MQNPNDPEPMNEREVSPAQPQPPALPAGEFLSDGAEPADRERNERDETPRFMTAEEIAADVPAQVRWLVSGLVARFCITEITAKAKAGKTTFILAMVRSILAGADFLGFPVEVSPVVYLTEERLLTFRMALDRAGLLDQPNLHILTFSETDGLSWPDIVTAARRKCREVGAKILVIDTLAQFVSGEGLSESNPKGAFKSMAPLLKLADAGLAILIARHERKSGGTVGDAGRGSSAFTGLVDVTLSLKRLASHPRSAVREITSLSRLEGTPPVLYVRRIDAGYVIDADATASGEGTIADAVWAYLAQQDEPKTLDEVCEAVGHGYTTVRAALDELLAEGRVSKSGTGRRNRPYRYTASGEDEPAAVNLH